MAGATSWSILRQLLRLLDRQRMQTAQQFDPRFRAQRLEEAAVHVGKINGILARHAPYRIRTGGATPPSSYPWANSSCYGVLPPLQSVPWPPPAEAPFLRITTLSRDFEIRSPVRVSISSCSRGSVQLGRSAIGADSTAETTESAARAFTGSGPGALRARRPETPSQPNVQRQWRTLSGFTANALAIRTLDQPSKDSKIARARLDDPVSGPACVTPRAAPPSP